MRTPVNTASFPRPPRRVDRPTRLEAPSIIRAFEQDPLRRPEFSDAKFFTPVESTRVSRASRIDPIALMAVYIDTEQVFLRSIESTDRQCIHDAYHDGGEWFITEIDKDIGPAGKPNIVTTGYQVKMQLPQPAALDAVDRLMRDPRGYNRNLVGSMTRQDFAVDCLPLGGRTKEEVDRYLFGHLIQPNRRPGPLFFHHRRNTTYWKKNAHLMQHSRDIVHYSDQPPKLRVLGDQPISHLDLRSRGSRTIQADGFETLADSKNADPIEIVRRAFYFTDVDIRPHAEAEAMVYGRGYKAPEQAINYFIRRRQLHTAQRVKEMLHIAMTPDPFPPMLILPRLLWR